MSKRRHGEGCWDSISVKGITYKRFRINGHSFTGKTEKECKTKYSKWKNGQKTNLIDKKTTVNQVAAEWLDSKRKHIKASTYDGYEYFVKDILGKRIDKTRDLGSSQILNVTSKQVQQYVDSWADFLPKSSIKKNKALLRQIFKYAKKEGIISIDPTEDIIIPSDNNIIVQTKEHVFITTDDRQKLEHEMSRTFSNNVPIYGNNAKMVIFLLHTGLRFGELTALKWKNVNFKEKKIFIIENSPIIRNRDKSLNRAYVLDITSPKRKNSERYVPLSNKADEIIHYFYDNYAHEPEDLVFVSENGTPANRRNVNRTLKGMLVSAGCKIQNASVHDPRHSFGSELIKQNVDIKVVSKLMGHADVTTTYNIYIHILDEQCCSAVDIFNLCCCLHGCDPLPRPQ